MATTASRLIADIDRLPHPQRQRTVIATARRLMGSPELDAVLDELFRGSTWEQLLSLRMADVAGHGPHVRRCLTEGSPQVTGRALGAAVRLGVADDLLDRLDDLPPAMRRGLAVAVRRARDERLADALLDPLRERFGDREAAALLPACSAPVVARELPSLGYALPSWTALARRHATLVLDHVDVELAGTAPASWAAFLRPIAPAIASLALTEPSRVLDIYERSFAQIRPLTGSISRVLAALARHDPERVLAILLAPSQLGVLPTGRKLWRALTPLDDEGLVRVARLLRPADLVRFLHALPPARRPAIYGPVLGGRDLADRGIPLEALDELPWQTRHAEAQRLLPLRSSTTDPSTRLELTARLPWAEAEPALRAASTRSLAEERLEAYPLLVLAAASTRDPAAVEGLVTSLHRLRNEQDPVRSVALRSLARIPTHLVSDAAADALAEQAMAAVQARDAAPATRGAARLLSERLIRAGLETDRPALLDAGLRALRDASGHLDHPALAGLAGSLPRSADGLVTDALLPRIRTDARTERFGVLLDLAASLGERAWGIEELQQRLAQACRATADDVVRRAVGLWLAPPATRGTRVAELLKNDASTITIPVVAEAVASRRTDLLDAVFDGRQRGRFATGRVRHVPAVARHTGRWMPRQVERYRALLAGIVANEEAGVWERVATVGMLGRVPGGDALLRELLDSETPQLADAAISAIAWTDEPASVLPALLARADGDRAHVALSAATRCASFVPPAELVAPLTAVLSSGKVTARKEACRLLAEHRPRGALSILSAEVERPDQHRDVRRAVVSALRHLLDEEAAWTTLATAAEDDAVATALLEVGAGWIAPRHRQRYALLLRDVADGDNDDVAWRVIWTLSTWVRWDDTGALTGLGLRHLTDVDRSGSSTWRASVEILVAAATLGDGAPLLAALDQLLASHADRDLLPEHDAAGERDLPARQRIDHLATKLAHAVLLVDETAAPTAHAAARAIAAHPLLVDLVPRPALQSVPWLRPDEVPNALLEVAEWCADPGSLQVAVGFLEHSARVRLERLDEEAVLDLVRPLVRDSRPAAARLGLVLLEVAGDLAGWTEPRREELRGLRRHPDPAVRLAAVQVLVSSE